MRLTWLIASGCFAAAVCAAGPISTTNLLTNPGAESGLTGWSGSATVDSGTFDPGIDPHSGSNDFAGGTGNVFASLSQTISLVGNQGITAADIDAGNLLATVLFWEQGLDQGNPSDDAEIALIFHSETNGILSAGSTPVLDSHNGSWEQETQSFGIPTGTRSIEYTMEFIRNAGSDNDAFVDDNSLTIASPAIATVPEPSTLGLSFVALLGLGALLKRRNRNQVQIS